MTGLLLTTLFLPLAGAILLLVGRRMFSREGARNFALVASLATLAVSLALAKEYVQLPADAAPRSPVQPRYSQAFHWLSYGDAGQEAGNQPHLQFDFLFGVDGISLSLIVLTTLLTVSCVLISWEAIKDRAAGFYACLLFLEAGLVGVFTAFDLIQFYVFFEFTLVPLFFLFGIWGGPQRRYAAVKFFLYTFVGSLVTLVGLVALVLVASSGGLAVPTSIPALAHWLAEPEHSLDERVQVALFLAISV